jgi:two-component system response regulator (stage 0 sporulation protein F)
LLLFGSDRKEVAVIENRLEATASHKPVVLVVDDNEELRKALNIVLQQQGFDVWLAASGQEALEIQLHHRDWIDLYLIDVEMPGLSGPQTLEKLQGTDVACCFMTTGTEDSNRQELLERGAVHIFEKPLDLLEVSRIVRQILSRHPRHSRRVA